jgi:hypothetical protein
MSHFRVAFVAVAMRNSFTDRGYGLCCHKDWASNHTLFLNSRRKDEAICRRSFRSAYALFLERGITATTMDAVAEHPSLR